MGAECKTEEAAEKKERGSSLGRDRGSHRQSAEEKKAEERTGLAVETRRAVGRAPGVTLNLVSAGEEEGGLSAGLQGLSSSRGLGRVLSCDPHAKSPQGDLFTISLSAHKMEH